MNNITRNITFGLLGVLLGISSISFLNSGSVSAASLAAPKVAPTAATAPATTVDPAADCPAGSSTSKCNACKGLAQIDASQDCGSKTSGVSGIIKVIVSILSYIVGVAAVVMVIVAGLKYVTSAGDSSRISSAKNTLVYALVGLAIAALAQVLVHLVLTDATKAANGAKITDVTNSSQPVTAT